MARFLRTVIHQDVTVTAAATPIETNLGVNPISFLLVTIRAVISAANATPLLANLLGVFSSLDVRFKGTSIVSLSLADLHRMSAYLWGRFARQQTVHDDASTVHFITVPVPFSRVPYWQNEAFPATRSGDLILSLTPAASFTNITTVTVQVEQIELLDAVPAQFLKYTTFGKTPGATGEHDTDLPLGNPIVGVTLFGTTAPGAAATVFDASIGTVKLLVDNVENYYSLANWESLRGDTIIRAPSQYDFAGHNHETPTAVGAGVNTSDVSLADLIDRQYVYLDFDPLRDNNYLLETEGRGRVHLRINADVADAIRIMPVELIRLPGAEAPVAAI